MLEMEPPGRRRRARAEEGMRVAGESVDTIDKWRKMIRRGDP